MSGPNGGLKHSPLESEHLSLGARMTTFAGWWMPLEYAGTLSEHRAVRERVGVFDLTHLGKVLVQGGTAMQVLQRTVTNDLAKVPVGAAQYNMVLNQRGGIVDDLIVYRIDERVYLVVPNAANTTKVHQAILTQAGKEPVEVIVQEDVCIIAPQGPRSFDLVGELFPEATGLEYMHGTQMNYRGDLLVVSRSGYTGERGFELFVREPLAADLWRDVLKLGEALPGEPCGLGARDTLRLEMGYPLHGNDISEERTPLEAGLSWAVAMDKGDFVGREALARQKEEGIPSRLWGLKMKDRPIPRAHYPVYADGEQVGETTSGGFSPTLSIGIAMAYLAPRDGFKAGDDVEIDIRGRRGMAEVFKPPFVQSSPK